MARVVTRVFVVSLVVLGFASVDPVLARDLFLESPQDKGVLSSDDPAVVRSRAVRVDFDALLADEGALSAGPVPELTLNLFGDVTLAATLDENVTGVSERFAWVGRTDDGGQVVLVASGGQLAGSVKTRYGSFRILPAGANGAHVIEEVDLSQLPDEAEPVTVDDLTMGPEEHRKAAPKAEDGSLIDLLVVYTPASKAPGSVQGGIVALIHLGVAETNTAFANSGINTRLRLVHVAEVPYQENPDTTIQTHLFRLLATDDGFLDEVHTLRDRHKADLVQLVGVSTNGGCGIGFLMRGSSNRNFERQAFSYTAARCISPAYTLAHELGHNLGSNHAIGDPTGQGAFNYSYGYKDFDQGFRTVMAYPCEPNSCPRVLHFSSPAVSWNGHPTGSEIQNNARSIDNVRVLVANFRVGAGAGNGGGSGGGDNVCRSNRSAFRGCKGGACKICAEKIAGYESYLVNHPGCIVNTKCRGKGYVRCSVSCPPPMEADR